MAESEDPIIRSVSRALEVLRVMNTAQRWTLGNLARETGLPKTTLFRILATLRHEGYVEVAPERGLYAVTGAVRGLGGGYTEQSAVVAAGSGIALRVTREIKWPLAIGVMDGDSLVVAYSTMPSSPLAIRATTIGRRLNLYDTAMGLAFLAHSPGALRDAYLSHVADVNAEDQALWERRVQSRLAQVKATGYAVRVPAKPSDSATLAVPICDGDEAVAALGMTTFGRTMTAQTIARYLPVLRDTAKEIAAAYVAAKP